MIDAGDGLPLTDPARCCARGPRERGRRRAARLRRRRRSPTRDAERRSAALARGLLAAGRGHGHARRPAPPERPRLRRRRGSRPPASARSSVPLSTFSTSAELRGPAAQRRRRAAARGARRTARTTTCAALRDGRPRARPRGRRRRCSPPSVPVLRRIALRRRRPPASIPGWTLRGRSRRADGGRRRRARRGRGRRSRPADRHGRSSTRRARPSEPKGVIHTHGALIRHLDNLNQIRRYTPGEVLFSNSPFFWIGGFAYALLGTLVAGAHARLLERGRRGRRARRARARAADDGQRLRRSRSPTCRDDPTLRAAATCRRSAAATSGRSCRTTCGRPIPELRHAMLGMTETGSVCLASDDESRPARAPARLVRPAGARASRPRIVDPDDAAPTAAPGEAGELWFRGPFLMEGYDGRERHEIFDADGWYRTGDLVTRRRRRLLLLPGPQRRHDQDRRRERLAARGRGGDPRRVRAGRPRGRRRRRRRAARWWRRRSGCRPTGPSTSTSCATRPRATRLSAYKVPRRFLRRSPTTRCR